MAQEAKSWDPGSIPGRDTSLDVPESSCLLSGPGLQPDSRYVHPLLLRQQRRREAWRWSSPWSGVVDQGSSRLLVFWGICYVWGPCRGERETRWRRGKRYGPSIECWVFLRCSVQQMIAGKTFSPKGYRRLPRTGKLLERLEAVQLHNRLAEQWEFERRPAFGPRGSEMSAAYLPTVPISSGQSRFGDRSPTSRPTTQKSRFVPICPDQHPKTRF